MVPPLLADYVIISVLSQTGSSACLKKAFCKTCVTIALRNPDDFILVQAEESVDSQKISPCIDKTGKV